MASILTLTGLSGKLYQFTICDPGSAWNALPGLYAFVDSNGSPQYIGKAANLSDRNPGYSHEKWGDAQSRGAVKVAALVLLGDDQIRTTAEADLIRAYDPPCNVQHRTGLGALGQFAPSPTTRHATILNGLLSKRP